MIPQIPTKLFLPKKLFNSLTDWTKANYTSWGWKNVTIDPKSWTVDAGITMTQVDESTFSFRGANKYGGSGIGASTKLITGLSALVRTPKSTKIVKVQIGTLVTSEGHIKISPAFSDSAYNYFYIDALTTAKDGIGRFYTIESATEKGMDIRFFDPYIILKSHLKPISVGDKLGLVYWDGDHSIIGNYVDCCNVAGDKAYTLNVDAGYFNYYVSGDYIKLLDKAGTVNLSNLLGVTDFTVLAIRGTEFQKHLFHVI